MNAITPNRSEARKSAAPLPFSAKGPAEGLLVTLDAKPGKQEELAALLSNALHAAAREPGTLTWYAYRITDTKFGIFDTFFTEEARAAHLDGEIARALGQVGAELLAAPPRIQPISIVTSKI